MLKPVLKLIRHRGRGVKAPALPAASTNFLLRRFGRASRGHVLAGAGVIAAALTVVSLLTWWAPDSDRPIGHPLDAIERVLPGVLDEVDEQVATLLGVEKGTVLRSVREGLVAVGSGISRPVEKLREVAVDRSASTSPAAPAPAILPGSNTAAPTPGEPSSTSNESPRTASEPAAPSRTGEPSSPPATETPPPTTSEPASPSAPEAPPPTTSGSTSPPTPETPPVTEAPSPEEPPPPTPEKLPLPTDEIADEPAPPTAEEPPSGAPPSPPEAPPSVPDEPPPATDQPPPPPPTGHTADAE